MRWCCPYRRYTGLQSPETCLALTSSTVLAVCGIRLRVLPCQSEVHVPQNICGCEDLRFCFCSFLSQWSLSCGYFDCKVTGRFPNSDPEIPFKANYKISMAGLLVPLKGGIGGIVHPPIGRKNTTYIPLIVLAEPGGWKKLPIPPFIMGI